jgi:hypothetical protein
MLANRPAIHYTWQITCIYNSYNWKFASKKQRCSGGWLQRITNLHACILTGQKLWQGYDRIRVVAHFRLHYTLCRFDLDPGSEPTLAHNRIFYSWDMYRGNPSLATLLYLYFHDIIGVTSSKFVFFQYGHLFKVLSILDLSKSVYLQQVVGLKTQVFQYLSKFQISAANKSIQ